MTQAADTTGTLVRVSVRGEGRRLDVGIPTQIPLIELMPGFARNLGLLDATMTHTGYALQRADGRVLDAAATAAAQGVADGDVLTLTRGGLVAQPRVYDDVVEAVIDATERTHRAWTPADGVRTALAASLMLLAVCALVLVTAGRALPLGALIAGAGSVVLIAVAAVVARLGQGDAGHALGLAAGAFAAVSGLLALPDGGPVWGMPMALAGAGALVAGGIVTALMPHKREIPLGLVVAGAIVAVTAGVAVLLPAQQVGVYAVMAAVVATAAGALPWLAMSSTRIRVISPHTDAEVFADPTPIDGADVARRAASGSRLLLVSRLALGACVLVATPVVAAANPAGSVLCALAFLGAMFPARQTFARSHVVAIMTLATVGLGLAGVVTALGQPGLRAAMLVILAAATAVVVAVTVVAPATRMRLSRLADGAELVILAALLPVGVIAAGLA